MKVWGKTDIGRKRRDNQDNFFAKSIDQDIAILCVCDGMGGQKGGYMASKYALKEFVYEVENSITLEMTDKYISKMLKNATKRANEFIFDMAKTQNAENDMGTTLVGGLLYKNVFYVANIGDSRCYHIGSGEITPVTKDHSLVQVLIDSGTITYEQSLTHPDRKFITRAVGMDSLVKADIYKVVLEPEEYILLCSDGLYNVVSDNDIKRIILENENIKDKCEELIKIANTNGGYDNITAAILQF